MNHLPGNEGPRLYDPARHEPLRCIAWDEAEVRADIGRIVSDAHARFTEGAYWAQHPLDRDGDDGIGRVQTSLYYGACGVVWALRYGPSCFAPPASGFGATSNGRPATNARTGRRTSTGGGSPSSTPCTVSSALPLIRGRKLLAPAVWTAWEQRIVETVRRTCDRVGNQAKLAPPQLDDARDASKKLQFCRGAPDFVVCLPAPPSHALDDLLGAARETMILEFRESYACARDSALA